MGLILKIAAGIVLAVILLAVGCSVLVSAGSEEAAQELEAVQDELEAEIEADIAAEREAEEEAQRERVSWEWVEDPRCRDGARCWQITVSSELGCPDGLYAELNILDANGTVTDYTNDSLGSLGVGQSAILTFDHYGSATATGEISKVSCY